MGANIFIGIVFILAGALISFAGYRIRFKHHLSLIAGYEEDKVKDRDGLRIWVGNGILAIGALQALSGLIALLFAALLHLAAIAFFIVTLGIPIFLISRISRFTN
jgi:hypothetical protein